MSWFAQQRQLASGSRTAPTFTGSTGGTLNSMAAPIPPSMGYVPPTAADAPRMPIQEPPPQVAPVANSATSTAAPTASTGLPAGYSLNPTTGMGGYTLASYSAPGLAAPNTNSFAGVDPNAISSTDAYKFRMGQGQEQIERSAAAKGTLLTGGTLKDLTSFAQGLASTEYDKQFDRDLALYDRANNLFDTNARRTYDMLSGVSSFGMRAADGQAGAFTNAGNAQAAGTLGSASAVNQGVTSAANTIGEFLARRRAQQPQTPQGTWTGLN